jgi:crossover junction endodeoxyribonuclease RuvC
MFFHDLEFEMVSVALTAEQVKELDLPSTPMKEGEKRAADWRAAFGIDQTEIDALTTPTRRPILERMIRHGIPIGDLVDAVYADDPDGGPVTAPRSVNVMIHKANRQLFGAGLPNQIDVARSRCALSPGKDCAMNCDDCARNFQGDVRMAPMLHDRSWCQLAPEDKTLCSDCMFKRADDKGIKLTLADLKPCPFNLQRGPFSWFERFAKDESAPPNNLAEWQDASPSLSPRLLRWIARASRTFKCGTTTKQTILGVDPGIRGGLAIISFSFGANVVPCLIDAIDIPVAGIGAKERVDPLAIRDWIARHAPQHAFVERAQAMPKQGASSGFKYGRSVGAIEAVITCCGIPLTIVEPTAWKKFHQLRGGDKESGRQRAATVSDRTRAARPQKGSWPRRCSADRALRSQPNSRASGNRCRAYPGQ